MLSAVSREAMRATFDRGSSENFGEREFHIDVL
jgi:hypothetical protein